MFGRITAGSSRNWENGKSSSPKPNVKKRKFKHTQRNPSQKSHRTQNRSQTQNQSKNKQVKCPRKHPQIQHQHLPRTVKVRTFFFRSDGFHVSIAGIISTCFPFPEPMVNSAALNSISSEPSENVEEGGEERITSRQTPGPPDDEKPDQSQVRALKSYLRRAENRSHIQHWRLHVHYIRVTVFFLNLNRNRVPSHKNTTLMHLTKIMWWHFNSM